MSLLFYCLNTEDRVRLQKVAQQRTQQASQEIAQQGAGGFCQSNDKLIFQ